jgi:hypothetical protein
MDPSTAIRASRPQAPRPPKPRPLVRSVAALRAIVMGATLLSLGGMTAYAGTHVQNSSAPLAPAAAVASMAPTAVAQSGTGTLTLSPTVPTTTAPAVTTTHHS